MYKYSNLTVMGQVHAPKRTYPRASAVLLYSEPGWVGQMAESGVDRHLEVRTDAQPESLVD